MSGEHPNAGCCAFEGCQEDEGLVEVRLVVCGAHLEAMRSGADFGAWSPRIRQAQESPA